ncbi:Hypothetical protein Minf_0170 [Methylacidiphilum infernorum V4]|uniref:Uncharacterized protein n=1 Tax=Methylacidiphilum infernorum (isolate V4) TaxID=481448 RepID=B3DXJ6_METI4|nr:Hypothetical protein Minf_0170 [Methylacidiphilum infernorum V4]
MLFQNTPVEFHEGGRKRHRKKENRLGYRIMFVLPIIKKRVGMIKFLL